MLNSKTLFRKAANFFEEQLNEGIVIIPLVNQVADMKKIFTLKDTAQFIWNEIDGTQTFEQILEKLVRTYDIDKENASADMNEFLLAISRFLEKVNE